MPQAEGYKQDGCTVVTPGNYDGVHRGHQVLLARTRALAAAHAGWRTRVVTFHPHPAALLAPEQAPEPLTTPERRRELLLAHDIDEVEVVAFTQEYADLSPSAFIERMLASGACGFVVGHDFRFGRRAQGDADFLRQEGQARGFAVDVVDPVVDADLRSPLRISSTAVRNALRKGQVTDATALLGRVHDISGEVIRGDQRGRALGFPTANLLCEPVMRPADGVYAVMVRRLDAVPAAPLLPGVANLGMRPTFDAGRSLEVHLLDYEGGLYGERLRVGFVDRIRGERRFDGVDALREQIARDCDRARSALTSMDQGKLLWI